MKNWLRIKTEDYPTYHLRAQLKTALASLDPSLNTFTTVIIIIIFIVIVIIIIIIIIIIVIINSIFLVIITCCFRTIQGKSERNSKLENENEVLIIKFK